MAVGAIVCLQLPEVLRMWHTSAQKTLRGLANTSVRVEATDFGHRWAGFEEAFVLMNVLHVPNMCNMEATLR